MSSVQPFNDQRIAHRIFPVQFEGWLGNRFIVPDGYFGIIYSNHSAVKVITGDAYKVPLALPWYWTDKQVGLLRQSFETDICISQLQTRKSGWGEAQFLDCYARVKIYISEKGAGRFYSQFLAEKAALESSNQNGGRGSLYSSDIGQLLSDALKRPPFFQQISEYTRHNSVEELRNNENHQKEINYLFGSSIDNIFKQWGVSAYIDGKVSFEERFASETKPFLSGSSMISQKQDQVEIQKLSWINILNDAFQFSQLSLSIMVLIAGLIGINSFTVDFLSSYWVQFISIFIVWIILLLSSRPTIRKLAKMESFYPPSSKRVRLDSLRYVISSESSISFNFWRPAMVLVLAIWATFNSLAPGWWIPGLGALLATSFLLLYLIIPDDLSDTRLPRFIPAIIPFLILAWFDNARTEIYALAYMFMITILARILSKNAKDEPYLFLSLSVIFTPMFAHMGSTLFVPLLLGFVLKDKFGKISLAGLSGLLAFGLGYFQLHPATHAGLAFFQTGLQAIFWATATWAVGIFSDQDENYSDLIAGMIGLAVLMTGLLVGHFWLLGQTGLLISAWGFEIGMAAIITLILTILPRAFARNNYLPTNTPHSGEKCQ